MRSGNNRRMRYGSFIGWGIVIYALMFLTSSIFALYGFQGLLARVTALIVLITVATIAGRSLRFHSWKDILPYSLAWTFMVILLDSIVTVPFSGWALFHNWNVWVGYALVTLVPLFAPLTRPSSPRLDS